MVVDEEDDAVGDAADGAVADAVRGVAARVGDSAACSHPTPEGASVAPSCLMSLPACSHRLQIYKLTLEIIKSQMKK